jgi:hypothetical protein
VSCFEFVFVLGRGACFFFGRLAEEAALVLRDGNQRQLSLSSKSFLLLLLLICSEKGVLKVNRAEEIVEPNVGTKSGCIWWN